LTQHSADPKGWQQGTLVGECSFAPQTESLNVVNNAGIGGVLDCRKLKSDKLLSSNSKD